jgi:hypothetical protein
MIRHETTEQQRVLLDILSELTAVLFPAVYVSFFLGTIVVLVFAHRRFSREVWLAGFFTTLLAVTLVGMPLLPVVDMHKFDQPSDEEETYYDVRIVDAAGNEIRFDDRATPPVMGTRTSTHGGQLAAAYTDAQRVEMAEFLVSNAAEYREELESGDRGMTDRLQPPRYVDDRAWTAAELDSYGPFEAIRVYERTVHYGDDNTEVETNEERLRVTVDAVDGTVDEHDSEDDE